MCWSFAVQCSAQSFWSKKWFLVAAFLHSLIFLSQKKFFFLPLFRSRIRIRWIRTNVLGLLDQWIRIHNLFERIRIQMLPSTSKEIMEPWFLLFFVYLFIFVSDLQNKEQYPEPDTLVKVQFRVSASGFRIRTKMSLIRNTALRLLAGTERRSLLPSFGLSNYLF